MSLAPHYQKVPTYPDLKETSIPLDNFVVQDTAGEVPPRVSEQLPCRKGRGSRLKRVCRCFFILAVVFFAITGLVTVVGGMAMSHKIKECVDPKHRSTTSEIELEGIDVYNLDIGAGHVSIVSDFMISVPTLRYTGRAKHHSTLSALQTFYNVNGNVLELTTTGPAFGKECAFQEIELAFPLKHTARTTINVDVKVGFVEMDLELIDAIFTLNVDAMVGGAAVRNAELDAFISNMDLGFVHFEDVIMDSSDVYVGVGAVHHEYVDIARSSIFVNVGGIFTHDGAHIHDADLDVSLGVIHFENTMTSAGELNVDYGHIIFEPKDYFGRYSARTLEGCIEETSRKAHKHHKKHSSSQPDYYNCYTLDTFTELSGELLNEFGKDSTALVSMTSREGVIHLLGVKDAQDKEEVIATYRVKDESGEWMFTNEPYDGFFDEFFGEEFNDELLFEEEGQESETDVPEFTASETKPTSTQYEELSSSTGGGAHSDAPERAEE